MSVLLEDYIPVVKYEGLNTDKAVALGSTLAVTGAITATGGVTGDVTGDVAASSLTMGVVEIADAATYTVLAANSGKVHVLPDLTADCTISLPTAANGLMYEFILGAAIDAAHDWIIDTGSDTNFYIGGLQHNSDAPASNSVASNGSSNSIVNVLTPEAGTWVKVWCDGTNWYLTGVVHTENAPTFANQS